MSPGDLLIGFQLMLLNILVAMHYYARVSRR
jgi:hypothetical protein